MSKTFKSGDIVRLKKERAESWLLPLRKWAYEGRQAVVVNELSHQPGTFLLRFDQKRKSKRPDNFSHWVSSRYFERAALGESHD